MKHTLHLLWLIVATSVFADPVVIRTSFPANTKIILSDSAVAFSELELNDGCTIAFAPGLKDVNITCAKLILKGRSTIDLTPDISIPGKPAKPAGKPQAGNGGNPPNHGEGGSPGSSGLPGTAGINLNFSIQTLDAPNGSLWIKSDGTPGGPGGDGGDGGKGSSGPKTGVSNPNGGNGGGGGVGGKGGRGGDTSKVVLKLGPNTVSPTQADGVAPSNRPSTANSPGAIVVYGNPGAGGPGGAGGSGGGGGEGHEGSFLSSDSQSGSPGGAGANGASGDKGAFTP